MAKTNKHNLKEGEKVKHKSDGTIMVVIKVFKYHSTVGDKNKPYVKCSWMNSGEYKRDNFYHYELERVKDNNN